MEHPKRIGDRTTLAVMLAFAADGCDIAVPFGVNTRYDLIVDRNGVLSRVQCKTGRLRDGAIRFATSSTYGHLPSPREVRRDYLGQVDEFAVYCPETGGVYVIPIGRVQTRAGAYLRVDPPRNAQVRGVRFANEFHVASIWITGSSHSREPGSTVRCIGIAS